MPAMRGLLLPLLALSSVLLTALYIVDIVRTNSHASVCEMTYSWPVYTPLDNLKELPAHRKYSLYSVHMQTAREQLTGVPVLFIPGHMGSYKQARSIARHLWDIDHERFDVFAVDFQEEFTALNGRFVDDQAHYVNDAVRAILKMYQKQIRQQNKTSKKQQQKRVAPESVVVVAHSMGGVVVRTAELLANYKRRSIQHVISFGSPYEKPPFPFDSDAQSVYSRIDKAILPSTTLTTPVSSTVYVSISGGHKDTTIHASMSLMDRMVAHSSPPGLALLTSKMPHVGVTMDHLCLVWCHQLLKRVALSLDAIVDRDAREIIKDQDTRLEITRSHLLLGSQDADDHQMDAHSVLHRQALIDGYHSVDEFATYGMLLPQALVRLFRARGATLFWLMYLLVVHIFHLQLSHWQRRFDLQGEPPATSSAASSTSTPSLSQDHFPSLTSLLHPAAHAPGFLKTAIAFFEEQLLAATPQRRTRILSGLVAVVVVAIGVVTELSRRYAVVKTVAVEALEMGILYLHVVGLLYTLALIFSAIRVAVQPIVRVLMAILRRTRAKRWFCISVVYVVVQLLGHVRDFELLPLDSMPRHLALLVLGSVVVFGLHVVELGAKLENLTSDQQRYRATLFALLALSALSWVGKVVFFLDVVKFPPKQLTNDLLTQAALAISTLALFRYFITTTESEMVPLPPTAFFDNADGTDENDGETKKTITAENCPKCVFEDGGPGAIFIEYENSLTTKKFRTTTTNELVVFGPTFRVVSCDCVFRFTTTREYCDFCTRSCRLCGGGSGNYAQAQKYRDFVQSVKTDVALHSLVPLGLEGVVVLLLALFQKEHYVAYTTPAIILMLVVYHGLLRHPVETNNLQKQKRKQEKKESQKKKPNKKTASARRRSSQKTATTPPPPPPLQKPKTKTNKSKANSNNSTFSLMEEYGATESVH